MTDYRVAAVGDIPEGSGIAVDVGDKRIAVFRYEGKLYALDETCPHRGAPLHEGSIEHGVLLCPWHGWQFELASGCSPRNPLSRVQTYKVRVEGESIYVTL